MKNIILTDANKAAAWARVYAEAMRQYLARKPIQFGWLANRRPSRDELNERPRLR